MKKPSVIVGAVILFFVLLFLLNRGGGSSNASGQTVVNQGPTDAQVASQTQLALAQISAGLSGQAISLDYAKSQDVNQTQLALATIAAGAQGQSLAVQQEIADRTVDAQTHGLDLQYQTAIANNNFALGYANQQFQYGLASQSITAHTQEQMSQDQLTAFQMSTNANLVMGLVGHNHYSSIALPAYFGAQNNTSTYSQAGTMS